MGCSSSKSDELPPAASGCGPVAPSAPTASTPKKQVIILCSNLIPIPRANATLPHYQTKNPVRTVRMHASPSHVHFCSSRDTKALSAAAAAVAAETDDLYDASAAGAEGRVAELLAAGAVVDKARTGHDTPAWAASLNLNGQHNELVQALLSATPLLVASAHGHASTVKLLLGANAAVNQTDVDFRTAVHLASTYGFATVVALLVAAGANVNLRNKFGSTPLIMASQVEVVAALLSAGADVNLAREDGVTPLIMASQDGHAEVVAALLGAGADVNKAANDGDTPLIMASRNGHAEVVTALLGAGADVNLANKDSDTPLYVASDKDHADVVKLLVCAGADLQPLMCADEGFELKTIEGETCVIYTDECFCTFFCASEKNAADAKAYSVEHIIEVSAVDGSAVAFRITSRTGDALDLEALSPELRDILVRSLNKLFTLEKQRAVERAKHYESIRFFSPNLLRCPTNIDPAIFASVLVCKSKTVEAKRGTKFFADITHPEGGTFREENDALITDKAVLVVEKGFKAKTEAEDKGFTAADLHGKAVSVRWLLALTFALNLWGWKTWEVRYACRAALAALLMCLSRIAPPTPPLPPAPSGRQVPGQVCHREPRSLPLRRPPLCKALHEPRYGLHEPLLGRPLGRPCGGGVRGGKPRSLRLGRCLCGASCETTT